MKSKVLSAIGGVLVCGTLYFFFIHKKEDVTMNSSKLRMHVSAGIKSKFNALDPAKIVWAQQYLMLMNLFSSLVQFNESGEIVSDLATDFKVESGRITFEFSTDLVSSNGEPLGPIDAELSLKRLLILSSNTHGFLKDALCPNEEIKTLADPCRGIKVDGNTLVLEPEKFSQFLLPMLGAIDFSIIPSSTIDREDLSLKNFENTSGPYYVGSYEENGSPVLHANKNNKWYSENIPQKVLLVAQSDNSEFKDKSPFDLFDAGVLDYIPIGSAMDQLAYPRYAEITEEVNIRKSGPLNVIFLGFTDRGNREFSVSEKLGIGKVIKSRLLKSLEEKKYGQVETSHFFSRYGNAKLAEAELSEIKNTINNSVFDFEGKNIKLGVFLPEQLSQIGNVLDDLDGLTVSSDMHKYYQKPYEGDENHPHIYLLSTDTTFNEDISLISYTQSMNQFPPTIKNSKGWVLDYMNEPNAEVRQDMMRKLHRDMLLTGTVIPVVHGGYHSIIRKPWKEKQSYIHPAVGLWQITRD